MSTNGKTVIHSAQFVADCVSVFGCVEAADSELAFLDAELSNDLIPFKEIGGVRECRFRSFVVSYEEQGLDRIELKSCARASLAQTFGLAV